MPPKPKEPQFERSKYRLKTFGRNTAKKGEVTEAALGEALEEFGKVWQVLADPAKDNAFVVTFKSTAAVDAALQRERITVGGRTEVKLVALPLANPSLEKKEQFFLEFFSKTSQKPSSMAVTDTFDSSKVYPPGSDVHFSVQLTNKATQPRELQGVLMPYQTHKMFTLSGTEGKGAAKFPIKLPPGGSHTQAVKFTSRPHQQGIFKHTMLFNFSNWVRRRASSARAQFGAQFRPAQFGAQFSDAPLPLGAPQVYEHVLTVNVAAPRSTEADLELLRPSASFVPRPLAPTAAGEDASVMIPAFAPNDKCSLKGSALYLTLAAGYSGKAALEQHEVPIDIHQIVEGKKSSNFNPWKTKANWRQRLHELLWLEEAQMGVLTRAYDLADVQAEAVPELREADGTVVYPVESLVRVPCDHLAEKRPSVQRGDRVLAWAAGGPAHIQHEGFVHQVEGGALVILFSRRGSRGSCRCRRGCRCASPSTASRCD